VAYALHDGRVGRRSLHYPHNPRTTDYVTRTAELRAILKPGSTVLKSQHPLSHTMCVERVAAMLADVDAANVLAAVVAARSKTTVAGVERQFRRKAFAPVRACVQDVAGYVHDGLDALVREGLVVRDGNRVELLPIEGWPEHHFLRALALRTE
jgi:hypothetical protein